jgi:hypothetical protein
MEEKLRAPSADRSGEPLQIEGASAMMAGETGYIFVSYRYSKLISGDNRASSAYVLDETSGKRLNVRSIPRIGPLISRRLTRAPGRDGYFMVDNGESVVKVGSKITVMLGELRKEGVVVNGYG